MNVKIDRRTQSRKRPLSLVYVELPPSNGGMMRDLNEHGFSVRAMVPLHLSEKLAFSISLDNGVRIDGEAIVVRLEDNGHAAAFEFAGLAAHSRDQIRRWLEKFEEPLSREAWPSRPPEATPSTLEELRREARRVIAGPRTPNLEPAPLSPEPSSPLQQEPLQPELPERLPPVVPFQVTAETSLPPASEISPQETLPPSALPALKEEEVPPVSPPLEVPLPAPLAPVAPPLPRTESEELPLPKFLRQPEIPPSPPPVPQPQPPPKPSSVRPAPAPEPAIAAVRSLPEPNVAKRTGDPHPLPLSEVLIQPSSVATPRPAPPHKTPPVAARSRVLPPALEPLSLWETDTDGASRTWLGSFTLVRAVGIMIFLTLLVGSVVYHREVGYGLIWLGTQIAGDEPQETSQPIQFPTAPSIATPQDTATTANAPQTANPQKDETPTAVQPPSQEENSTPPHAEATPSSDAAPLDSSSGTGQAEYQQAMQILKTPSRKVELPEAVRLLWLAVRKNHVGAAITLAELYHQGRGVAKSCAQTQILLSAAARRGSPDAKRRLEEFESEGCQD